MNVYQEGVGSRRPPFTNPWNSNDANAGVGRLEGYLDVRGLDPPDVRDRLSETVVQRHRVEPGLQSSHSVNVTGAVSSVSLHQRRQRGVPVFVETRAWPGNLLCQRSQKLPVEAGGLPGACEQVYGRS